MEKEFIHQKQYQMMDHTHQTHIQPDSVQMTNLVNKEYKLNKDLAFYSLKQNNLNIDFVFIVYLLLFHLSLISPLQQGFLYKHFLQEGIFVQLICDQLKQKIIFMNQHIHTHERDISSSQDHCRCQACRNQQQLKNYQRQNPSNIYMYKHLKKRGVPPVKKQLFNKDLSHKAKYVTKKQELEKKLQPQKIPATPIKHKLIQALKAKQTPTSSFFIDYHPVSHSQRQKLPSKDGSSNIAQQPRRGLNIEDLKGGAFNKQNKTKIGFTKLVQISQNPENIRMRYHNSRSVSQASASCNQDHHSNSVKSLEKIKD